MWGIPVPLETGEGEITLFLFVFFRKLEAFVSGREDGLDVWLKKTFHVAIVLKSLAVLTLPCCSIAFPVV